jgi:hypothetical protein
LSGFLSDRGVNYDHCVISKTETLIFGENMKKLYSCVLGLGLGMGILTNYIPLPFGLNNSSQFTAQAQQVNNLENFTGYWNVASLRHGDSDESSGDDVYFTVIEGRLVGILNDTTLFNLTSGGQNQYTGEILIFKFQDSEVIKVEVTGESSNNDQELNLQIKLKEFDVNSLSLSDQESEDIKALFANNIYMTLEKMTPEKMAQEEAKTNLGMIARGQQIYYGEMSEFTDDLELFALGFVTDNDSYNFQLNLIDQNILQLTAIPKNEGLNSYLGGVFVISEGEEITTQYIICETQNSTIDSDLIPILEDNQLSCPSEFKPTNQ